MDLFIIHLAKSRSENEDSFAILISAKFNWTLVGFSSQKPQNDILLVIE